MLGFGLSIEPQLWALFFVMIRIGATFIAAPVFGNVSVPVTVRGENLEVGLPVSLFRSSGPSPFREVWNMTKPVSGTSGWLVAGVQALQ